MIRDILEMTLEAKPDSDFVSSLLFQYEERGGLSKKQLQGLHKIASKVKSIPPAKLATLEAVILKKPTRFKSKLPESISLYEKDEQAETWINEILSKYPEHKRVLFFKMKTDNNEMLAAGEKAELERFHRLLVR